MQILACAGWLDYVESNVSTIEYLPVERFPSEGQMASGNAICGRCKITIATIHTSLDIAAAIVHEAAHLEDDCQNGEYPAIRQEQSFRIDYRERSCR